MEKKTTYSGSIDTVDTIDLLEFGVGALGGIGAYSLVSRFDKLLPSRYMIGTLGVKIFKLAAFDAGWSFTMKALHPTFKTIKDIKDIRESKKKDDIPEDPDDGIRFEEE